MDDILTFDVEDGIENRGSNFNKLPGVIYPVCKWQTEILIIDSQKNYRNEQFMILENGFVINPEQFFRPSIRISPFNTSYV
jgi:hypothetical protein